LKTDSEILITPFGLSNSTRPCRHVSRPKAALSPEGFVWSQKIEIHSSLNLRIEGLRYN